MAIHDAYARRTPYEVAIPGRDFTRDHFPGIRDEAAAGGTDTRDPARFVFLGSVGHAICGSGSSRVHCGYNVSGSGADV